MNAQKLWIIGTAIVAVAVLVLGWFVGVQPQLAALAATDEQRRGVDAQNQATEQTVDRLAEAFEGLDALESERDALRESIPVTAAKSELLDQIDALADASGTTVTSVTTSELRTYTPPPPPVEADPDGEATDAEAPAEGETPEPDAPAAPVEPTGPPVITDPLVTAENFYAMDVTVAVTGTNDQVLDFVEELQQGDRLFLLTQLQIGSDEETGLFTATSTGSVYVLVDPEDVAEDGADDAEGAAEGE